MGKGYLLDKFFKSFLKLKKIKIKTKSEINKFLDKRLNKTIKVKNKNGKKIFEIYDFGELTRFRALTFFSKEPETIEWIESFKNEEVFLDVGANIGIYSLYAAHKGIHTISVEPDSLNNAMLNLNINLNSFGDKIIAFALALHEKPKYSYLNIQKMQWGGALNSFDNCFDQFNEAYYPTHKQGVFGESLDNFLKNINKNINHLKIDVDGNESYILKGSKNTLDSKFLKTILIELDINHKEYEENISLIKSYGFNLVSKKNSIKDKSSKFKTTFNHIFVKK